MGVGLVSESRCVFGNLMTLPVDPVPLRSSSAIDLTVAEITNFAVAYWESQELQLSSWSREIFVLNPKPLKHPTITMPKSYSWFRDFVFSVCWASVKSDGNGHMCKASRTGGERVWGLSLVAWPDSLRVFHASPPSAVTGGYAISSPCPYIQL